MVVLWYTESPNFISPLEIWWVMTLHDNFLFFGLEIKDDNLRWIEANWQLIFLIVECSYLKVDDALHRLPTVYLLYDLEVMVHLGYLFVFSSSENKLLSNTYSIDTAAMVFDFLVYLSLNEIV